MPPVQATSSQPIVALLIAIVLFAIGRVIIRRTVAAEGGDPWLAKALLACLILHLIAAPMQIWVVDHLYGGIADYTRYDTQGAVLSGGFRHFNFSLAPADLRGIDGDGAVSIVAGVIFAIIGVNQAGAFLVMSFLSFIGFVSFYRAFTLTFSGAGSHRYGYLIFFLPPLLFWTSDVSKEAIMTFLLGLTAYGCARILAHKGRGYLVVIAASSRRRVHPTERDVAGTGWLHHRDALPAGECQRTVPGTTPDRRSHPPRHHDRPRHLRDTPFSPGFFQWPLAQYALQEQFGDRQRIRQRRDRLLCQPDLFPEGRFRRPVRSAADQRGTARGSGWKQRKTRCWWRRCWRRFGRCALCPERRSLAPTC